MMMIQINRSFPSRGSLVAQSTIIQIIKAVNASQKTPETSDPTNAR